MLALSEQPGNNLNVILDNSLLSPQAKQEVYSFINDIIDKKERRFEKNYDWIISFENTILQGNYSSYEKEILLSLTSIARYSLFLKKRRDDKDWDLSVGNLTGGVAGSMICSYQAVYGALVAGLYNENH